MAETTGASILALSARIWQLMSGQDVDRLEQLIDDDAVFVHMGATFTKEQELEVIRRGQIHYRDIHVSDTSLRRLGATAIVLTTMEMTAVVDGNEVTNPFVTTSVFIENDDHWRLGALAFTRLLTR
ncbi:nuclear transport factor 2 family protein [Brachybacterium paraconglomeratum]|uniref:nuclear transport factor 2 family protein n=1 Tax=Brachybacterium paraconglomeratum TaxID=173362 RepID=UPI0022E1E695|nr:nuclear transport factor 2 family protein [Brachybacterium paraconglomeratum]